MGKELKDGLSIDNSFRMTDEKKIGFHISARVIQFLAIVMGSWSTVSVLLECLHIQVDLIYIYAALLISAGITFALCLTPSYDLVKLFFAFLFYGLFFYSRLSEITNAFYIVENLVIDRLVSCYNYAGYYFSADYSFEAADTVLLVILTMIPVIALLSIAIVRNRLVNFCSLVLFLPVSASFLLGKIPSEKYLIVYLTAVLYLTRSGFSYHRKIAKDQLTLLHRINSRAAVWMSLMALLAFYVIRFLFPIDKYEDIKELDDMNKKVQQTFMNISLEDISENINKYNLFNLKRASGGLLGGELGENGEVTYNGEEHLFVNAPYTSAVSGIYLKGYVGCVYSGNSWDAPSKSDSKLYDKLQKGIPADQFSTINQTNLLLGLLLGKAAENQNTTVINQSGKPNLFGYAISNWNLMYQIDQSTMKVEYKKANKKYIYAPYYTNYDLLDRIFYEKDLYAAPQLKRDSYDFNYYNNLSMNDTAGDSMFQYAGSVLKDYSKYEKQYRDYVYKVYTELPKEGLSRLKKDFSEKNLPEGLDNVTDKMEYVKNYLSQNTTYTLAPGKLPKGEDFVEYFLYKNKKGYCSHYASAAVLMLRIMGIPSRYVEGYAVSPVQVMKSKLASEQMITTYTDMGIEIKKVKTVDISVTDKNAHAWVEVYIDGCGWVPAEFTPGSAMDYNNSLVSDFSKAKDYIVKDTDTAQPTIQAATPTPAAEQIMEDNQRNQEKDAVKKTMFDLDQVSEWNHIFIPAFFLLWITAFILYLVIRMRRRKRIRNTKDYNKRVLLLLAETEKILFLCKNGLPSKNAKLEDCEDYIRNQSPYIDSQVFIRCMEIARKARFGKERITQRELSDVESFYRKLYRDAYAELPMFKKLYTKIILIMQE